MHDGRTPSRIGTRRLTSLGQNKVGGYCGTARLAAQVQDGLARCKVRKVDARGRRPLRLLIDEAEAAEGEASAREAGDCARALGSTDGAWGHRGALVPCAGNSGGARGRAWRTAQVDVERGD